MAIPSVKFSALGQCPPSYQRRAALSPQFSGARTETARKVISGSAIVLKNIAKFLESNFEHQGSSGFIHKMADCFEAVAEVLGHFNEIKGVRSAWKAIVNLSESLPNVFKHGKSAVGAVKEGFRKND